MSRKDAGLTQLIDIAKDGSHEKRRALFLGVADLFVAAPECSAEAAAHVDAILCALIARVDAETRREAAARFAEAQTAPKMFIRHLALDDISVAEPVLKKSGALTEHDLLSILAGRGQAHLTSIAERPRISERVSAEIVRRGETAALAALAANREAEIGPETMEELVARARLSSELQAPLTRRLDLSPPLLTALYFFVSPKLKKEILRRAERIDTALVDHAVASNRRALCAAPPQGAGAPAEAAWRFVCERIKTGGVAETLLKELVAERRSEEFAIAFSYFVGIDAHAGRRILETSSLEPLAIAARAAKLDRATFARILFGLPQSAADQKRAVRILDLYQKIPEEAAERIMRFWRMRAASPAAAAEEEYGARPSKPDTALQGRMKAASGR